MIEQLIEPAVSRAKFDRELAAYKGHAETYRGRGWLLLEAEYPRVLIAFAKPGRPPMIVFGAQIDFTNYDFWAPSVVLVDPFSGTPYTLQDTPTRLIRLVGTPPQVQGFELLQGLPTPDAVPFICIPGIREYHEHPAHTNDPWLRRRGQGEGTLHFIIAQLSKYGLDPVTPQVQFNFNISFDHAGLPPR